MADYIDEVKFCGLCYNTGTRNVYGPKGVIIGTEPCDHPGASGVDPQHLRLDVTDIMDKFDKCLKRLKKIMDNLGLND